jgi:hypothetical protein
MNDESAPKGAHEIPAKASSVSVPQPADIDLHPPELTSLAKLLIGRVPPGQPCPRYGSAEWDALPDQDPRRAAAVLRGAEAWRRHCSPWQVAQDLADEMAATDLEIARRVKESSWDISRDWSVSGETHAELARRRTDYDGGVWARERLAS